MSYKIVYDPQCYHDLKSLDPPILKKIKKNIESKLMDAPAHFGKPLRYTASGLWSLRIGDYRVIYQIHLQEVLVLRMGHRREIYSVFKD